VQTEKLTGIPEKCIYCGNTWISGRNPENYVPLDSAYRTFVQSIMKVRTLMENGSPFKILLEFREPKEGEHEKSIEPSKPRSPQKYVS